MYQDYANVALQSLSSEIVAEQAGCCERIVNKWVKRYEAEGVPCLQMKDGRGRRSILKAETDMDAVRRAVQSNRQRVSLARAELET